MFTIIKMGGGTCHLYGVIFVLFLQVTVLDGCGVSTHIEIGNYIYYISISIVFTAFKFAPFLQQTCGVQPVQQAVEFGRLSLSLSVHRLHPCAMVCCSVLPCR